MRQYLWDFSFEELFIAENGQAVMEAATLRELSIMKELRDHFEKVAQASRNKVQNINQQSFSEMLPELMHNDMVLQLALIYSLSISESLPYKQLLVQELEAEALTYFYEYRTFDKTYDFEKYSLMQQIAVAHN